MLQNCGIVTYMMADSSMQHGRDFEHVIVQTISKNDVLELFTVSNQLIQMWSVIFDHGRADFEFGVCGLGFGVQGSGFRFRV